MFSDNSITPCGEGYKFTLTACPVLSTGIINLSAGLDEGETYFWFIEDKFGNIIYGVSIVEMGILEIPLDDFPVGSFTPYSGEYKLWLTTGVYNIETVELTLGTADKIYNYILLNFKESNLINSYIE